MYKNNTVNIQTDSDTEYIGEFRLVFFSGGCGRASLGSVHSSYIHGHAWLSDWGVSGGGAGGRVYSWDLFWRILSLQQGLGSGLGGRHLW